MHHTCLCARLTYLIYFNFGTMMSYDTKLLGNSAQQLCFVQHISSRKIPKSWSGVIVK
jgi:hypothetical protein